MMPIPRFMKLKSILVLLMLCMTFFVQAQNHIKHTVSKGETITQISQRYKVTPYDIYRLNPDAQNGLKENSVLLIPVSEKMIQNGNIEHQVASGETLFKIANQYQLKVDDLLKHNPGLTPETLQPGQLLKIPVQKNGKPTDVAEVKPKSNAVEFHTVEPKETKFGIAKKYEITIAQLEQWNPEMGETLAIGDRLRVAPEKKNGVSETKPVINGSANGKNMIEYTVRPKETLYSITREFNVTQEELLKANPALSGGLQDGMVLLIPVKSKEVFTAKSKLTDRFNLNESKEIVLLLPFNISKIQSDTTLSVQARLKRDNFLNLTLDFYAGALMAIDSARKLQYPVHFKIFDSQENRSGSDINGLIAAGNFKSADAVIGPFYPQHMGKVAKAVSSNVPIISPLREVTSSESNLLESMPSQDLMKSSMIDFLRTKNGRLIALIDTRRSSFRRYMEREYPEIFIAPNAEKGGFIYDSISPKLSRTKTNYFLLETASTGVIMSALSQINQAKSQGYAVQLVLLEMNPTFETDEIFPRILRQKAMFPSLTNARDTQENLWFANAYKKRNNVFPNQYAMRGFDVTFDVIQRLIHEEGFFATISKYHSDQLDFKFDYQQKPGGGYQNKGVYILYYDEDFQVKTAE